MKTSFVSSTWLPVVSVVALCMASATASAQSHTNKIRIGVYDSRTIAIAYYNSSEFQETLKPIMAELAKAKEAKEEKRIKEIESRMKTQQRRTHEQGFSTGSVIPIMAKIKSSLPDVAKKAGVQIIVSKWELNFQSSDVEVVDVTDDLAALFHVSERGSKWVHRKDARPPIPIDEITDDMD